MIRYNKTYLINNGVGTIVFTEGKEGNVTSVYEIIGKKDSGIVNGILQDNVLKGTYENKANNSSGLMEITFREKGFDAKWKAGLDPGPMRGKWVGTLEEEKHELQANTNDAVKNGHHVFIDEDGVRFEGEWENDDFLKGKVEYLDEEGEKVIEEGTFKDFTITSGKITYENGMVWEGDFDEEGVLHGQGKQTYFDEDAGQVIEEGIFEHSSLKEGKITWADGSLASGTFDEELELNGKGFYSWANGDFQDGTWVHGEFKDGKAKITHDDGEVSEGIMKDGEWVEEKENTNIKPTDNIVSKNPDSSNLSNLFGQGNYEGVCTHADLTLDYSYKVLDKIIVSSIKTDNSELFSLCKATIDKFRWDWWMKKGNGEFHTKWNHYFEENKHLLIAETKRKVEGYNSTQNSSAISNESKKVQLANGETYEGETLNGSYHGKGIYTWPNGKKYEGDFLNGNFNGKGTYTWPEGHVYDGDWSEGKRQGLGKLTSPNGEWKEGKWVNDEFISGIGKSMLNSGDIYEGEFIGDKMSGKGKYTWKSGTFYEGTFINGVKYQWFEEVDNLISQIAFENGYNKNFKNKINNLFSIFSEKDVLRLDQKNEYLKNLVHYFNTKNYLSYCQYFTGLFNSRLIFPVDEDSLTIINFLKSIRELFGLNESYNLITRKFREELDNFEMRKLRAKYWLNKIKNSLTSFDSQRESDKYFYDPYTKKDIEILGSLRGIPSKNGPALESIIHNIENYRKLSIKSEEIEIYLQKIEKMAKLTLSLLSYVPKGKFGPRKNNGTLDRRYKKNK